MNASKPILTNVSIIRPILLVLLVFYHAFAIYSGAWAPIEGYPEVPAYWWLDKLSYAFMLEMFVFISGYVFGFQVRAKGEEKLKAKNLLWGKFKRLMIPCMVFSLLYILLFGNITQPVHKTLYSLVNGVGHMWFLPMLFHEYTGYMRDVIYPDIAVIQVSPMDDDGCFYYGPQVAGSAADPDCSDMLIVEVNSNLRPVAGIRNKIHTQYTQNK